MASWSLAPEYHSLSEDLGSLESVFELQGERLTKDPLSEVIRIERHGVRYYVKRYWGAGKGLRRYLGRPRVKAEWQNLKLFAKWGIPTAPIVAHGLERKTGAFVRGALVTRELENTLDLAEVANRQDVRLTDQEWVQVISQQLAKSTRTMHDHHFTHNDLKWRNLLVNEKAELFFIDCPTGSFWWGPLLRYRIVKDLACLDKVAKRVLSRTQRLRFYLQYRGRNRLSSGDKRRVLRILKFFEGRE
ncbi:lipopolysaccharide kinase (Kdo/WaaP) family protein [Ectopseudomonas oleovorans]|uniref:Lipopolysaccharide kinase (Kdo/WaaP) family protein n=2 Tax=Pseudomonadaceae TaxID=135621 RepID=A0A397NAZ1_ECTOL|nr:MULTISPECIES: lipopolysaccharide kinase InaA family protein [Pseudomonas]QMV64112.1 heptose kinase [Pseudomonas berkeleyensis]RIA34632.1 lipopolysaccharide kinase (Kdo/WaaP) family protein [Pseudomonas oleovorans]WSO39579.1 lipopolysaccharide kinase InaA family protein [Pseudomonas berkeleyensis]